MQLPVTIQRIILSSVTITTALTAVDLVVAPGSISNVVPIVYVWLLTFQITFVLVTFFGIRKAFPIILRLKILFYGLMVLFFVGSFVSRDIVFLRIDLEELFAWCGLGSFSVGFIFTVIFLITGFRHKSQEG